MGQKGWHSRGYLPHLDGYDIVQHVVFRLHDSLPIEALERGDEALDRGFGRCILREPGCAQIVLDTLVHDDGVQYDLRAWCVMPNHVHVLMATNREHELGKIVGAWKGVSARRINTLLDQTGSVWAADYFDRFMRNDAHYETTKRYIENNPVVARLCSRPEDWPFSSRGRRT